MDLPTGIVTFLFTDIEGSTRLWERQPEAMRGALARHDQVLVHGARFTTEAELRQQLRRYLRYYNHRRLHSGLDIGRPLTTSYGPHRKLLST